MKFLTLVLSLTLGASAAHSFEVDLSYAAAAKIKGVYLVEELTIAAKGRISTASPCVLDGVLVVSEESPLYPKGGFIVSRKPTGNLSLVFSPLDYKGKPETELRNYERPPWFVSCEERRREPETFTPVDDIDGFTKYSDWAAHVLKTFTLDE